MANQQGKWREEQVLIICPGSKTTLAQLGCGELTPPAHRFPTRMFKDEEDDDWRPYHTTKRRKTRAAIATTNTNGDAPTNEDDEWEYVEDADSAEGAVYPMQAGHIVNMEALLAFLDHVHGMLTTTYHNTPILIVASPQWTRPDCEAIAQYIFEKTKTPALSIVHSGVATQYGLKWPSMTVVDIGFEKVDVTCIYENRVVSHRDIGAYPGRGAEGISGGEVFTQKLMSLLKDKDFSYDMAEQLKQSPICEVLPYAVEHPKLMELPTEDGAPQSTTTTAAAAGEMAKKNGEPTRLFPPVGITDDDGTNGEAKTVENEGILDVANILASGQAREILAKKEKEKAEKAKSGKRGKDKDAEAAAAKVVKLPNSKRLKNTFHYEDFVVEDMEVPVPAPVAPATAAAVPSESGVTEASAGVSSTGAANSAPTADAPTAEAESATTSAPVPAPPKPGETATSCSQQFTLGRQIKRVRRDVDVGLERFLFADRTEIDRIVGGIYRAVQSIHDMYMRPQCWENLVFVGNGSRVRGLKENILQTLHARHLVAPSSATMFTSELPSNLGTPSGTGSQTPTGSFNTPPHQLPTTSSVNPLLQAATTANLAMPGVVVPASNAGDAPAPSHHFHSQTPTAIKLAPLPTYMSEWNKHGFEEAMFLGAQVAARLAFCIPLHNMDNLTQEGQRLMSLNRVEYNELGPKGIRTHSMLG